MSPYDVNPVFVSFLVKYLHAIGAVSTILSILVFFLLLFRTPSSKQAHARFLIHAQVWLVALDFTVCFLFVPLPIFPIIGALCYGFFCQIGGSPHILVVVAAASMGYAGTAITLCFHFRYEVVISIARREPEKVNTSHWRRIVLRVLKSPTSFTLDTFSPADNERSMQHREIICHYLSTALLILHAVSAGDNISRENARKVRSYLIRAALMAIISMPALSIVAGVPLMTPVGKVIRDTHPELNWAFTSNISFVVYSNDDIASYCIIGVTCVSIITVVTSTHVIVFSIFNSLKKYANVMSAKTRLIQRKLTETLIIQGGIPIGMMAGPILFYVYSMMTESFNITINSIILCVQMSHSIVHSILVISLTDHYRHTVLGWFGFSNRTNSNNVEALRVHPSSVGPADVPPHTF